MSVGKVLNTNYFNEFNQSHAKNAQPTSPHGYLKIDKKQSDNTTGITYKVVTKAPTLISEYTHKRLTEISHTLKAQSMMLDHAGDQRDYNNLLQTARLLYGDYKSELREMNWFQRALNSLLSILHIRPSNTSIETVYQNIQELGPKVQLGGGLAHCTPTELDARRRQHRQPSEAVKAGYSQAALSKGPYNAAVKLKEREQAARLEGATPQQKAIRTAKLKEEACLEVYQRELDSRITAGYYDPAIIPYDIEKLLGPVESIKQPITSASMLKGMLKHEINKYREAGKLNEHQAHHLKQDAINITKRYLKVFPEKSLRDAFYLTRDLVRVATYQEYYDKASFNGSDHGSKHIHHNIANALALHKGMEKGKDYNNKDKFMEQLVHFYHDVGYTVGLANSDFDCCKDHPFIGAKMIEENRAYFLHYLDETSFTTLRDCVLYHAIVNPDLTARETKEGLHPGMVRAVTSISDACAVTYDRKTQEFWEQPRALVALAKLKSFLVLYPQYKGKLGDDIVKGPWPGYDETNPWDKMAYDIFQHTVNELNGMVDEYDISLEKKDLFRQAIKQQFNAFKANVTLGQYGAVLAGVEAVPNPNAKSGEADQPDYIPKFTLAPSIIYGVIRDLFGKDQANDAFNKLVAEFNGDPTELEAALAKITVKLDANEKARSVELKKGSAIFPDLCHFLKF